MEILTELVESLVAEQFPQWSGLPVTPVPHQGHDNRTFRLGDDLSVRLPSHQAYVAGVEKEDAALPLIAEHVRVGVPSPVALGRPSSSYPFPWSVRRWLTGTHPDDDPALDRLRFARDLGAFLSELRETPAADGPVAGEHSFFRGCHPSVYGDAVQAAIRNLGRGDDSAVYWSIWSDATRTAWPDDPVWAHGDLVPDNLLTQDGKLVAVLDFGTCAVGDPACDLAIAWRFFEGEERAVFLAAAGLPEDACARARGWVLWKSLVTLARPSASEAERSVQERALAALVAEVSQQS